MATVRAQSTEQLRTYLDKHVRYMERLLQLLVPVKEGLDVQRGVFQYGQCSICGRFRDDEHGDNVLLIEHATDCPLAEPTTFVAMHNNNIAYLSNRYLLTLQDLHRMGTVIPEEGHTLPAQPAQSTSVFDVEMDDGETESSTPPL